MRQRHETAAGIEPLLDSGVSDEQHCDCVNCQQARAVNALYGGDLNCRELALSVSDLQSVQLPAAVIRIAQAWPILPPHICEAVVTLIAAGLAAVPPDQRPSTDLVASDSDETAWRLARQCRGIVQGCLREQEWLDADREFFDVIAKGLRGE